MSKGQSSGEEIASASVIRTITTNLANIQLTQFFNENTSVDQIRGMYFTALPLIPIGTKFRLGDASEDLSNDFRIVSRQSLPALDRFKANFSDRELGPSVNAEHYLITGHPINIHRDQPFFDARVAETNKARIERFLLALNIIGRLWWISELLTLNWLEPAPEIQTGEGIGSAYLFSFKGDVYVEDFRAAAILTSNIEKVYDENEATDKFASVRVALDALNLAVSAGTIALRLIQNIIALEALCSTSTSEVQHRVGTTCAILLSSALEDRRKLYDRVTALYGARSRMVHGAARKITLDELKEIEQISRPLMRLVLSDELLPKYETAKSQKQFLLDAVLR